MALKLYDTWTRTTREFQPLSGRTVGMYCCGPTVYNYAHIGNLRTYIFEDMLRRALELNSYQCKHVVNITDVGHLVSDADEGEDKMEQGSRRTGKSAWELAEEYTIAFKADLARLNILEPSIWCKATAHIPEQISVVENIESKGYTYRTSDGIYFDTSKLKNYGYLARLDLEGLQAGMRVELGEKRNPTDFALWKFSPAAQKRQMEWESPWGIGFPGWHIECSAMSEKYLGSYFDIHCGGEDHISVHHSNEIAQTEVAHGTRLANFWLHGYFLQIQDSKMSKSSGEFLRLQVLMDRGYDPLAYRYLCLGAHYRSHLNFSFESLTAAQTTLDRLRMAFYELPEGGLADAKFVDDFTACVNDDLNVAKGLAVISEVLKSSIAPASKKATLVVFDKVLGLNLAQWKPLVEAVPEEIMALAQERQKARQEKRWADSDVLRNTLLEKGWEVKDTAKGPELKRKIGV